MASPTPPRGAAAADRIVFACSCEDSMVLDRTALAACGGSLRMSNHLCRTRLADFTAALAEGRPITVGCTQEAPLFQEVADEAGRGDIAYVNIREQAGWSDAVGTGPKMAALLAGAAVAMPPTGLVSMTSQGVVLVYGRDEDAIAIGRRLADSMDVTVMLTRPGDVTPPALGDVPVVRGSIVAAQGHLGAFVLRVDDTARPAPSSRARLLWGPARDGATSRCDVLLDATGGSALFPAAELRPGYLRCDPARPETVERAIADARGLVGTFDKPRYIDFTAGLCAHQRNRRTGCTRCLDVCPTGAITPGGDHVTISSEICAGCGGCAAVCPTGAASAALPPPDAVLARIRVMLMAYHDAGGTAPVLLLHDAEHGTALIDAAARFGRGLPANLIPVHVNEVTQAGLAIIAGSLAYGAAGLVALTRARPRHDIAALHATVALANRIAAGLGLGAACAVLETDDPDALWAIRPAGAGVAAPSRFLPMGQGRELTIACLKELHRVAAAPAAPIPLPERAPFGGLRIDAAACTLCHACVAACPTGALRDDPDRPTLRFAEDACVQCGLCRATCPEKIIELVPRLDPQAWSAGAVTVKQEEPYPCLVCGKPFGTRSSIERVIAKLGDRHWMFPAQSGRLDLIRMCEDCRVGAAMESSLDPHSRPAPRTAEDVRAREGDV